LDEKENDKEFESLTAENYILDCERNRLVNSKSAISPTYNNKVEDLMVRGDNLSAKVQENRRKRTYIDSARLDTQKKATKTLNVTLTVKSGSSSLDSNFDADDTSSL
jgi:hypothetical protein